jgi:uncharacterized membrane protein
MIRFFTPLRILLLIIALVATIAGFLLIPETLSLPIHWGIDGKVDATLPRNWALLQLPVLIAVLWTIFWAIGRFTSPEKREAARHVMEVALSAATGLVVLIQIIMVLAGLGYELDVIKIVAIGVGLMLVALGNVMPKSRPNGVAGIRIPTTMSSAANWQATHRLTGWLTIAGGLVLIVVSVFVGPPMLIVWLLGCVIVPMLIGGIYSIVIARRAA